MEKSQAGARKDSMKITAALMLKAPRPGTVKTRLAADLGEQKATAIYRKMVEHQLRQIPQEWSCTIHYSPADALKEMNDWLQNVAPLGTEYEAQCEGDLGARMLQAVSSGFACGAEGVILLGGDCLQLLTEQLLEAALCLEKADITIAPATDGGYVLLGLKHIHHQLFENIAWGTSKVLEQTTAVASGLSLELCLMRSFEDIDDVTSLHRNAEFAAVREG
jgi:uncharacterized protein